MNYVKYRKKIIIYIYVYIILCILNILYISSWYNNNKLPKLGKNNDHIIIRLVNLLLNTIYYNMIIYIYISINNYQ